MVSAVATCGVGLGLVDGSASAGGQSGAPAVDPGVALRVGAADCAGAGGVAGGRVAAQRLHGVRAGSVGEHLGRGARRRTAVPAASPPPSPRRRTEERGEAAL